MLEGDSGDHSQVNGSSKAFTEFLTFQVALGRDLACSLAIVYMAWALHVPQIEELPGVSGKQVGRSENGIPENSEGNFGGHSQVHGTPSKKVLQTL